MSNIKEILDFQIYPSIYQKIISVLPEFDFKRINKGFISTTSKKIDGSDGKEGKVYIYDNNISSLIDYTRGASSIWNYIQQRENLSNQGTLKYLADLAGVNLSSDFKEQDIETVKENAKIAEIWEEANSFFINCLTDKENDYYLNSETQKVREYLESRGYKETDLKDADSEIKMELGYIPSQEILFSYLQSKGFKKEDIEKQIILNTAIGRTHKLTIPYRDNLGRMRGIAVRNINHTETTEYPKYLYSTGLKRDDILFNLKYLKGNKDLVIVEGILDSLIAEARGMDNVVALGGTSLNSRQIELAKKYGAKKITLCLDNDEAGKKATLKALEAIKPSNIKTYIAYLPSGIKDPEQIIYQECNRLICSAIIFYNSYLLSEMFMKYENVSQSEQSKILSQFTPISWQHINFYGSYLFNKEDSNKNLEKLDNIIKDGSLIEKFLKNLTQESLSITVS